MQDKLNKIIQADCLEYLKSLPNECTECVLIDEPYMLLKGHKIEEGYNLDIAKQVRIEAMRVLKKDGWFIFFGQFPLAWDFGRITMEVGFKPWRGCNEIVWCKRAHSTPLNKISKIHENIFVFQKGKPQTYENKAPFEDIIVDNAFHGLGSFENIKRRLSEQQRLLNNPNAKPIQSEEYHSKNSVDNYYSKKFCFEGVGRKFMNDDIRIPSIWSFYTDGKKERLSYKERMNGIEKEKGHVTQKPVLLLRRLIKLFTQQGDTILDCFSGSGTTALTSMQEGRNFLCCERDEGYVKIANDRLANWQDDLTRQDKWLNDRGVMDFESDIKNKVSYQENTSKEEGSLI